MNKTKQIKEGLYVGKFIAYHKGHQNCINQFSQLCDKLKVVICTRKNDKVPAVFRKKWFENDIKLNLYKDIKNPEKIEFYQLEEDNIPLYPNGLVQWCNEISKIVGNVDIMFGNEQYVRECSEVFNSEFYVPDEDRNALNVSSTKIYEAKLKYYDYLTTASKSYFNKVVLILGHEQIGKTKLIKQLAQHYGTTYIEEYGRDFFENEILKEGLHGLSNWGITEFENLCIFYEEKLQSILNQPNKIIFIDACSLIIEVYSNLYIRQSSSLLQKLIQNEKIDKIFLLKNNNIPIDYEKNEYLKKLQIQNKKLVEKEFLYEYLKHSLNYFGKEYVEISNENRLESIKKEINSSFLI